MRELARRNLNDVVAKAERKLGPEQSPQDASPLFAKIKRLPQMLPWQAEMVPWAFGAVEYGERYWSQARQIRLWQIAFFAAGAAAVALACCLVVLASGTRVGPYVVQVDQHGYAVAIAPGDKQGATDERVVIASVAKWMRSMRTVLGDRVAQRALVDETYAMLAPGTAALDKSNSWFRSHNPFESGSRRVDVEITRVAPMKSATALTVEWTERTREGSGSGSVTRWSAYVEVKSSPVQKLEDVIANPLGVFVTDYSVSQLQ